MNNPGKKEKEQKSKRGRPSDSGFYDCPSFIDEVHYAFQAAINEYNRHPTQQDIADKLRISRPTLCRYLKNCISWRDVQTIAYENNR